MKKLIFPLLLIIGLLFTHTACTKHEKDNNDTTFTSTTTYDIYFDTDSNVREYFIYNEGEPVAFNHTVITNINPGLTTIQSTNTDGTSSFASYYLNAQGHADSVVTSYTSATDTTQSSYKNYYNAEGYLICSTQLPGVSQCTGQQLYQYQNGDLTEITPIYYYYLYNAVPSKYKLVNNLTGTQNAHLPESFVGPPLGPSHYIYYYYSYLLDGNGYPSRMVTKTKENDHNVIDSTFSRTFYTYHFD